MEAVTRTSITSWAPDVSTECCKRTPHLQMLFSISILLLEVRRLRISHFSHCAASTEWQHLDWIGETQITWIWPLTFLCFLVYFCHVELDFGGDGLNFVSLCLCVMMILMLAWISEGFRFRCSEVTCDCRYLYSWELSQATVRKH